MDDLERTRIQLKTLISIDVDPIAIATLCSCFLDFHGAHIAYLAGPIIKGAKETALPSWLAKTIYLDRVDQVFDEYQAGIVGTVAIASEVLAMLYPMYPATRKSRHKSTLNSIWQKLYIYCFQQTIARFNLPIDELAVVEYAEIEEVYIFFGERIRRAVIRDFVVETATKNLLRPAGVTQNAK